MDLAGATPLPMLPAHAEVPTAGGIFAPRAAPVQADDNLPGPSLFFIAAPQAALVCPGVLFGPNLSQLAYPRLLSRAAVGCDSLSDGRTFSSLVLPGARATVMGNVVEENGLEVERWPFFRL